VALTASTSVREEILRDTTLRSQLPRRQVIVVAASRTWRTFGDRRRLGRYVARGLWATPDPARIARAEQF
jgi:hypothetical protein